MKITKKSKRRLSLGELIVPSAVVGGFVLCMGMLLAGGASESSPAVTATALVIALLVMPVIAVGARSVFEKNEGDLFGEKLLRSVILGAVAVAAICVSVPTLRTGTDLVCRVMDIKINGKTAALILLGVGAYMASKGGIALKKFALAAFTFTAVSAVILLTMSATQGEVSLDGILPVISRDALTEAADTDLIAKSFLSVFAPSAVGVIWLSSTDRERGKSTVGGAVLGTVLGGAVLLVCFLTVALTIGLRYGAAHSFPYLEAVSAMTVGKLFMRPEGLVYISYLWLSLLTLSVCLASTCIAFRKDKKSINIAAYAAAAVIFALYLFWG